MKKILVLTLGFVYILSMLFGLTSTVQADTATDLQRRKLVYFKECLSDNNFDTDDDYSDLQDFFKDSHGGGEFNGISTGKGQENVVVGLDIDSGNGTQRCSTITLAGVNALKKISDDAEATNWFTRKITGYAFDDLSLSPSYFNKDGEIKNNEDFNKNQRGNLVGEIDQLLQGLGPDDTATRNPRLYQLLDTCYSLSPTKPTATQATVDEPNNFETTLSNNAKVYGIYRGDKAINDTLGYIQRNGGTQLSITRVDVTNTSNELGSIDLGWFDQDFQFNSPFFPFGTDRLDLTGGQHHRGAILSCSWAKDKIKYILGEATAITPEGKIDTPGGIIVTQPPSPRESEDTSCESGDGDFRWLMCPAIRVLSKAFIQIDDWFRRLLTVDANYYKNPGIEAATSTIRNLAYTILIPIMLVMVLSTALGFEFISAYTVKRALPRLFAAVIFITISYPFCVFMIEFFNVVGNGIYGLLTAPFVKAGADFTFAALFKGTILGNVTSFVGITIGILVAFGLFLTPILMFAATALIILLLRQILIVALLLVAPLAILAWIFPGNDKLWKAWWSTFSKLLMMFPIMMGLFAVGHIFAWIIHEDPDQSGGEHFLNIFLILFAYAIPYGLVITVFKFAGGVLAMAAGKAEGFSQRGAQRRSEKRRAKIGKQVERVQAGQAFGRGKEGGLRNKLGSTLQTASLLGKAGVRPRDFKDKLATARLTAEKVHSDHMLKENPLWQQNFRDDDLMWGLIEGGGDYDKTMEEIKQRGGAARFGGAGGQEELKRLTTTALNMRKQAGTSANMSALRGLYTSSTAFKNSKIAQRNQDGSVKKDSQGFIEYEKDADGDHLYVKDAAGKAMALTNRVMGHERGSLPMLVTELKQGAAGSGRGDIDASFSDLMKISGDLNTTEHNNGRLTDGDLVKATRSATVSVMEGNSVARAVASGKESTAQGIIPQVFEETEATMYDQRQDKWGDALPSIVADPEAHIKAVADELAYEAAANQAAAGQSKAALKYTAKGMRREIDLSKVSPELKKALTLVDFRHEKQTAVNATGQTEEIMVKVPVYQDVDRISHSDAIKNMERSNPEMAAAIKVYADQITSAAAQERAAQAQVQALAGAVRGTTGGIGQDSGLPPGGLPPTPTFYS